MFHYLLLCNQLPPKGQQLKIMRVLAEEKAMWLGLDRGCSSLPHSTSVGLAQRLWTEIIQSFPQSQSGKLMVVVG